MRIPGEILRKNRATCAKADIRLDLNDFAIQTIDRIIAIRELGGAVLKTFLNIWRFYQMAPWGNIQDLQDLTRSQPVCRKSGTMVGGFETSNIRAKTKYPKPKFKLGE